LIIDRPNIKVESLHGERNKVLIFFIGDQLPWYLSSPDHSGIIDEPYPDYVIASGQDAVPACLHITNTYKKSFSGTHTLHIFFL
jgi:hypothetical protein